MIDGFCTDGCFSDINTFPFQIHMNHEANPSLRMLSIHQLLSIQIDPIYMRVRMAPLILHIVQSSQLKFMLNLQKYGSNNTFGIWQIAETYTQERIHIGLFLNLYV